MGTNGGDYSPSLNSTLTKEFNHLISQTPFPIDLDENSYLDDEYEDD